MKLVHLFSLILIFVQARFSYGQQIDASPAGVIISHGHPKRGWMFSYSYMNVMMKNNLSGTEKVSDETVFNHDYSMSPQTMQMNMHMIMAMYGAGGRLSFMLMMNYGRMNMDMTAFAQKMNMAGGTMIMTSPFMAVHSSGLGDTKLYGLYKLINGNGSQLVLSGGINIPTGRTDVTGDEEYLLMRLPYMMQLGSGSLDLMPGITYLKKSDRLTWSVQVLSVIRPLFNSYGYHYGSELSSNAWAAYQFCPAVSVSVRLEDYFAGAIEGNDALIYPMNESDADPKNYGGQRTSGYAGINLYINKGVMRQSKIGVEFGIPVYQNLNGPQLSIQRTINATITKSL